MRIRELFEAKGFLIQQWDKVQTDMLTIIPSSSAQADKVSAVASASPM
jgi:hypothetical protein